MCENSDLNSTHLECPICLELISANDNSYTLVDPCNHYYHEKCILSWANLTSSTCPKCRIEIKSLNIVNQSKSTKIKHKEADKLVHMINNNDTTENNTGIANDGLANIVINTSTSRLNRLHYDRMVEATSSDTLQITHSSLFSRRQLPTDSTTNHLNNQNCCICDNKILVNEFIICPQCSSLYHKSCSDELNCPLCEEWIDNLASTTTSRQRGKKVKNQFADSNYYVQLVDELHKRNDGLNTDNNTGNNNNNNNTNSGIQSSNELDEAWNALNQIQQEQKEIEEEVENDIRNSLPDQECSYQSPLIAKQEEIPLINNQIPPPFGLTEKAPPFNQNIEPKLKRPKRSIKQNEPLKLTESVLEQFNRLHNHNNKHSKSVDRPKLPESKLLKFDSKFKTHKEQQHYHHTDSHSDLSYTQKLIIQRLLMKPRLKSIKNTLNLSFDSYTKINKTISHKLYNLIQSSTIPINYLNSIIELSEREGYLPFKNREDVDLFFENFKNNSIVLKFINLKNWNLEQDHDKTDFSLIVDDFINFEISKFQNENSTMLTKKDDE